MRYVRFNVKCFLMHLSVIILDISMFAFALFSELYIQATYNCAFFFEFKLFNGRRRFFYVIAVLVIQLLVFIHDIILLNDEQTDSLIQWPIKNHFRLINYNLHFSAYNINALTGIIIVIAKLFTYNQLGICFCENCSID